MAFQIAHEEKAAWYCVVPPAADLKLGRSLRRQQQFVLVVEMGGSALGSGGHVGLDAVLPEADDDVALGG